jgi:pilus assembly protein CpaD
MALKDFSIILGAALLVTGCTTGPVTKNRGLESVHQPVVSRSDFVFDLQSDGSSINSVDIASLSGWMESLRLGYGDHVAIDGNGAYDVSGVRDVVGALAARRGLLIDANAPITAGEIPAGHVRVIVSRLKASVPNCPDWGRNSAEDFNSNTSSDFGCATNKNLSAMIADPSELVSGRTNDGTGSTVSNARSVKAIQAQRTK